MLFAMEHNILNELSAQLGPLVDDHKELQDSMYLFAWLRRGNYNVAAAAKACKESYKWREAIRLKELEEPEPPAAFKLSMDEATENGSLIVFIDFSAFNIPKEIAKLGEKHLFNLFLYHFLQAEKRIMEINRKLLGNTESLSDWKVGFQQGIVFVNTEGVGFAQVRSVPTIRLALNSVTTFFNCFPSLGSQLVCVKSSKLFRILFNLLEPVVRGKALIQMYEAGNDDWIHEFSQLIRIDQIPESYGGTKQVPLDHELWEEKQKRFGLWKCGTKLID